MKSLVVKLIIGIVLLLVISGIIYYYSSLQTKADSFSPGQWSQNDFSGGQSNEVYAFSWGQNGGWNKYSSLTNLNVSGGNNFSFVSAGQSGEIVSSVFKASENTSISGGWSSSSSYTPLVRFGSSSSNMSDWAKLADIYNSICLSDNKYFQIKYVIPSGGIVPSNLSFTVSQARLQIYGFVYKNGTSTGINDVTVNIGAYSDITSKESGKGGSGEPADGHFSVIIPQNPNNTSSNVTAAKSGYQSASITVSEKCKSTVQSNIYITPISSSRQPDQPISDSPEISNDNTGEVSNDSNETAQEAVVEEDSSSDSETVQVEDTPITTQDGQKVYPPVITNINNFKLSKDKKLSQSIAIGQPIVISGRALAKSKVKLYVLSKEFSTEIAVNDTGIWQYVFDKQLVVGDHRIEAELIDENGNKVPRTLLAEFTVTENASQSVTNSNKYIVGAIAGFLAIALIAVIIYLIIKKRRAL